MTGRMRVAVTGFGAVTAALSGGYETVARALAASGDAARVLVDAERVDRVLADLVDASDARRLSRVSQLALAAARLAANDAGLAAGDPTGLVVGTDLGDLRSTRAFADGFLDRGPAGLSPLLFPNTVMNTMASATAIVLGARDLSLTINAPAVAGELAVARAASLVAAGRATAVLAGGVDERDPYVDDLLRLDRARYAPRGEGAAFLVLESFASAEARGARIVGVIHATVSGALPAAPHGVGRAAHSRVVGRALSGAGIADGQVRAVYTGACGDQPRDAWEAQLLDDLPGPRRERLGLRFGQSSALGVLKTAAATLTGPALVYGLARGGTEVALVVGPGPAA